MAEDHGSDLTSRVEARLSPRVIERIDAIVRREQPRAGSLARPVTRSDVIRAALAAGLDELERAAP